MGLALDEPKNDDQTLDIDDLRFVINDREAPDLLRHGALRVDYQVGWWGQSFTVQPAFAQACC